MSRLSRWAAFPLVCTFLSLICITSARASDGLYGGGKFTGWWELGGYYGTDESSRGEAVLFTPLMQSATTLFFLDARGKLFEEDVQEANIALGYRQMMASGWNLGLWAGWDVRDTEVDNTFHQVSFGFEALSDRFDLRVNGYVPVTDPKLSPSLAEVVLQGNNIFLIGGEEVALHGVDAEVGMLLFARNRGGGFKGAPAAARRHELRGYVGGFWFDSDDAFEEVAGPKGRLEYRINDVVSSLPGSRLTIESELSHDDVRDTKFEVGARLRIPFGARGSDIANRVAALNAQELRMIEGLERDTDIITVQSKEENVLDNATDVALNAVSFAQNATQFASGVNQGGNRLIILQKGSKRIDVSSTDGQQLQKNQTVQGGASTILMRGAKTGVVAPFTAPGKRPTLFTDDGNANTGAITLASNTHVAGLNIRGVGSQNTFVAGNNAIVGGNGLSNVVIEQTVVQKMGDDGIRFQDASSNVRIFETNFANLHSYSISFGDNNSDVTIKDIEISDTESEGINFESFNKDISIWNVDTFNTYEEAISFVDNNANIDIANVSINQVPNDNGISFNDFNRNVSLHNVRIADVDQDGIDIGDNNRDFLMTDIVIKRTGAGNGIDFGNDNRDFTFNRITTVDTDADGFDIGSDNVNVTIRNATIVNPGLDGFEFVNGNQNVKIVGTQIINPSTEGFDFASNNQNVLIADTSITGGSQTMIDGIELTSGNLVTIRNVEITDATGDGIELFDGNNVVNISNVTITNAGVDGLQIGGNNSIVTMNDTAFRGAFADDVIQIDNANAHTLSGDGNTFIGTFGNQFCNSGAQNGSFGFDVGPQATCP